MMPSKTRAPQNRTLTLTDQDRQRLRAKLITYPIKNPITPITRGTIHGDIYEVADKLPRGFVNLLILDPPYNLNKNFNGKKFVQRSTPDYSDWLENVVLNLLPLLCKDAVVYICGDWRTSISIANVASRHFYVRNRLTWEREKGRGSKSNWKNSSEDIWFCTTSRNYTFNVDSVKLRRRVLAPYRTESGSPKDWEITDKGNFRDTHPSNIWTDITIPFWSMPENTNHPTQKSEKLIAKLVLSSSNPGDFVFDPFLGSGTTSVVAKKLGRSYLGVEVDEEYCLLAERRLELAQVDSAIQGLSDGVFWERNTLAQQRHLALKSSGQRGRPKKQAAQRNQNQEALKF